MRLHHRLKQAFSGSFIRDVAKLSMGTLAGRGLSVAALPLLTRLYSPEDFALLATYVAIISTIAVASCLRLEIAIPLADTDDDARHLLVLALLALASVTLVASIVVVAWPQQLTAWTGQPALQTYGWLISMGIAALGLYSVMQHWATRERHFTQIAQTRISQAAVGVAASVSLGWAGLAPLGLLIGNLLDTSAGSLKLAASSVKKDICIFKGLNSRNLKDTFLQYKRYPIYSTPEAFFNAACVHVPILLVAAYAGAEAGFLMLAIQIMAAPMGLLGKAISQVYGSRAQQALQQGQLATLTRTIMVQLLKVGLMPLLALGILAPWLVPYVFGENWLRTGEIILWLVPSTLLQFVVSPVSLALHVTGKQVHAMWLQALGLAIRAGAVLLAVNFSPDFAVVAFALSGAIFYSFYCFVVVKEVNSLRCSDKKIFD